MASDFYRQLGTGVASLTFGVALSIFIYAVASGTVVGLQAWLLFGSSFLLMLRFWWRYNELFVQHMPSSNFWHFLFDFATAFFAILAVLYVGSIQVWALLGVLAMLSSAIRSSLSWRNAHNIQNKLRRTLFGALGMLVIFAIIYNLSTSVNNLILAGAVLLIIMIFVVYSSFRE